MGGGGGGGGSGCVQISRVYEWLEILRYDTRILICLVHVEHVTIYCLVGNFWWVQIFTNLKDWPPTKIQIAKNWTEEKIDEVIMLAICVCTSIQTSTMWMRYSSTVHLPCK